MKKDQSEWSRKKSKSCEPAENENVFRVFLPGLSDRLIDVLAYSFPRDNNHIWGYEVHLVNEPEYCAKLLVLDTPGVQSSLHYHKVKKETFIVLDGSVALEVRHVTGFLSPLVDTLTTLEPGDHHRFWLDEGCALAVILEVSTHDDPDDTIRIEEARTIEK